MLLASSAYANERTILAMMVRPGAETIEQIEGVVGPVSFDVQCPEKRITHGLEDPDYQGRTVRITLDRPGNWWRNQDVLAALLGRALDAEYQQCPMEQDYGDHRWDMGRNGPTEIYGKPSDGEPLQLLARATEFEIGPRYFGEVDDVYADRQAQVAQEQEQKRRAEAEAQEASARAAAEVQAAQSAEVQRQANTENAQRAVATFWQWVRLIGFAAIAIWLFVKRESIARWYYSLKPHPAAGMVDQAISRGANIDGDLYEQVLRPVPGSRVERDVRREQADELTRRLREHEAALHSESARRVEAERRRVEQENAFLRAHAELLKAGVDHEIAAARLDELRRQTRN
jgi:hypothetical protein